MGKIKVTDNCNGIAGLKVIEPTVFGDARGYFMDLYVGGRQAGRHLRGEVPALPEQIGRAHV